MGGPFVLNGPEFLAFFLVLSGMVLTGTMMALWLVHERDPRPPSLLKDPYLVAAARGDFRDVIRVAMVSLLDRKLLTARNSARLAVHLEAKESLGGERLTGIERSVFEFFRPVRGAKDALTDRGLEQEARALESELSKHGVNASPEASGHAGTILLAARVILVGVVVARLYQAFSLRRPNVGFLIAMLVAALVLSVAIERWWRKLPRRRMVRDLQALFGNLRARAGTLRAGTDTPATVMLAAVFGVAALSPDRWPHIHEVFFPPPPARPVQPAQQPQQTATSCSSSCGSSSSDSSHTSAASYGDASSGGDSGAGDSGGGGGSGCGGGGGGCGGCGS
jgi:uncharacterized protein (TIGR04222 family)